MDISFKQPRLEDKEFILNVNKEINILSSLNDSTFYININKNI